LIFKIILEIEIKKMEVGDDWDRLFSIIYEK